MNANELAEKLEEITMWRDERETRNACADLLRKQADLIRNLQKSLGFKNSGYETINLTPPVAWINLNRFKDEALYLADCVSETKVENMGITTPLYIYPVKELTDEEIDSLSDLLKIIYNPVAKEVHLNGVRDFAKAILRKASEK